MKRLLTAGATAIATVVAAGSLTGCRDDTATEPQGNPSYYVAPNASVFPSYVSTTGIPYIRTRIEGEVTRAGSLLDMNEAGWAVGSRFTGPGQFIAVAVNVRTGDTVRMGTALTGGSQAKAINARGEVVGGAVFVQPQAPTAFHWRDGVLTTLGSGAAMDINNKGVVVGYSWAGSSTYPWTWSGGEIQRLGTASGWANAINNSGQIVGAARIDGSGHEIPVIWRNGEPVSLDVSWWGEATSINERGQIVGAGIGPRALWSAFLWDAGSVIWLEPLDGGKESFATAINGRGEIVGHVVLGQVNRAVLWRNGQPTDLGLSGVTVPFENVSEAYGITNSGQVIGRVGQGSNRNGVIWTPPAR